VTKEPEQVLVEDRATASWKGLAGFGEEDLGEIEAGAGHDGRTAADEAGQENREGQYPQDGGEDSAQMVSGNRVILIPLGTQIKDRGDII